MDSNQTEQGANQQAEGLPPEALGEQRAQQVHLKRSSAAALEVIRARIDTPEIQAVLRYLHVRREEARRRLKHAPPGYLEAPHAEWKQLDNLIEDVLNIGERREVEINARSRPIPRVAR